MTKACRVEFAGVPSKVCLNVNHHWNRNSQPFGTIRHSTTDKGLRGARYRGATPSYVIWNLLSRYTRQGDVVVDPMCGSGTTLDVAADLGRTAYGFDLQPQRKEIQLADARQIPLEDDSADFVFIDPPYSTNLKYSDDPRCIGKLSAAGSDYFEALADVYRGVQNLEEPATSPSISATSGTRRMVFYRLVRRP